MFERMEIIESIYEVGAPSKNNQRAEADQFSFGRKQNRGGASSPSKPKKGCTDKRKRNDVGYPIDAPTGAKKTCILHGPGHSFGECKVLQDYSENHIAQRPFKDKQACSGGNKRGKTVKFKIALEEANAVKSHDEPIPKKIKNT